MSDLIAQSIAEHRLNAWYYQAFQRDNPTLAPLVLGYLDGGLRPTDAQLGQNHYAKGLVLAEDARRALAPPPPPAGEPYFVSDWASGKIGWKPWATIFQMGTPSTIDVGLYGGAPRTSSDDGRVAVIPNPYGPGNVLQCEIRNSDPPTGSNTFQKAEVGSHKTNSNPGGAYKAGQVVWTELELYLPDDFGLASGGSNGFTNIADFHPSSNSGVPGIGLGGYKTDNLQLYLGVPGSLRRFDFIPLDAAHRNRRLLLHIGTKFGTSGWVEAWLDGANVVPRLNIATAEASESGPYWKQGLYKEKSASFPNGGSRLLFGATRLYETRPF